MGFLRGRQGGDRRGDGFQAISAHRIIKATGPVGVPSEAVWPTLAKLRRRRNQAVILRGFADARRFRPCAKALDASATHSNPVPSPKFLARLPGPSKPASTPRRRRIVGQWRAGRKDANTSDQGRQAQSRRDSEYARPAETKPALAANVHRHRAGEIEGAPLSVFARAAMRCAAKSTVNGMPRRSAMQCRHSRQAEGIGFLSAMGLIAKQFLHPFSPRLRIQRQACDRTRQ